MLKKLVLVCLILGILPFNSVGFSAEIENKIVPKESVCMAPETSIKLTTELERCKSIEKITQLIETQNLELKTQTDILKEQVKLANEKYDSALALLKTNEDLNKIKVEALEKDLKEASKPRWGSMGISFSLGSILTLIAMVLL